MSSRLADLEAAFSQMGLGSDEQRRQFARLREEPGREGTNTEEQSFIYVSDTTNIAKEDPFAKLERHPQRD